MCRVDADEQKLQKLGDLMTASHRSCADAFECSCAELETLIGVAVAAGSVGSRLTGAGWGGCTVHLVREAEVRASFFLALNCECSNGSRADVRWVS